ncbi:MAG: hypothetical protein AAGC68_09110, partial [Verrucomicrobiota bacterium]
GGQNPVEPILAGRAVIVGPHMQNFSDVVLDLREAEGICQLEGSQLLGTTIAAFLDSPEKAAAMAQRGALAMRRHEGSATRNARFVLDHLESAP